VIEAYLVIGADGHRCVFLERVRADAWAAQCSGVVVPLVRQVAS